jgi:hypothetical protein
MDRVSSSYSHGGDLAQTELKQVNEVSGDQFPQAVASEVDNALAGDTDLVASLSKLPAKAKAALVRKLITQLETNHIQTILEFGLREIGDRDRHKAGTPAPTHNTRLLLKKDYSYQERGLTEPTQYYVYLRRRKPKLDRYIGALFYIPSGCTLSYFLDAEERIVFNPPHNTFQLRDSTNTTVTQLVRLICLEPPPADYTFSKQQSDTPEIRLRLEYLDIDTYQPQTSQVYPFPSCMHEGGQLDRYRWEVSAVMPKIAIAASSDQVSQSSVVESPSSKQVTMPTRQVLELPPTKSLTFYLSNHADFEIVLKRMRLWVTWSEKAMPQSRWEIVQENSTYILMNAHFKRRILSFSLDQASLYLENSLPVIVRWFHDLSLAVSQTQSQRQYSDAQLKQAYSLLVEMSLTPKDPFLVLKKLFGIEFSATTPKEPKVSKTDCS